MKTNKFWSIFVMLVLVLGSLVSFSSCNNDDDDSTSSSSSIIGTWEENGSTPTSYCRITFNKDGSGYIATEEGSNNFSYTYSYDSTKDQGALKIWLTNSSSVQNFTVAITGTKMMLTQGSSTSIFSRK